MKSPLLPCALLWCVCAAAQSPAPQATAAPSTKTPQDENAQKARVFLNQAIAAMGGQAYLNIQDISQQGRTYSFYHGQPNSRGILYWSFAKWPDRERIELTKQRDVAYVYSGDKGYEITYKGAAPMDPKDLAEYLKQRDFSLMNVLRNWSTQPDVALFYEGRTFVENKPAEQVTLMDSRNRAVTLFLDSETHLPVKKSFTLRDPETRDRNEESEVYANYHQVQGVSTPFDTTRFHNGEMTRQRFVSQVTYNAGVADSLFAVNVTNDPAQKKKK